MPSPPNRKGRTLFKNRHPQDAAREMKVWQQKIVECAHKRSAYQDQQAAGLMTLEELGSKLQEIDDARRLAHTELEALTRRQGHIAQLEKNRESLLKSMAESPGCSGRSDPSAFSKNKRLKADCPAAPSSIAELA